MKMEIGQAAISAVAKRHGVSREEVRTEIEKALVMAWGREDRNTAQFRDKTGLPEPEEFISCVAEGILMGLAAEV